MHNDDKGFLDYFSILEVLGQNRDLEQELKETKEMLTQVDVSRLPSYQWGREDTLKEVEALIAEKDQLLEQSQQEKQRLLEQNQQEKQRLLEQSQQEKRQFIKKMQLSGMSAAMIADLLDMPQDEVEQQISEINSSKS